MNHFYCGHCNQHKTNKEQYATGYGIDQFGQRICYDCCGKADFKNLSGMRPGDKIGGYYITENGGYNDYTITNWPGTLKVKANGYKTRNNWGYPVLHVWFRIESKPFYARLTGESKQFVDYIQRIRHIN